MPSTHFPATPIFDELQTEWEGGWRPTYLTEPKSAGSGDHCEEPVSEGVERDG